VAWFDSREGWIVMSKRDTDSEIPGPLPLIPLRDM